MTIYIYIYIEREREGERQRAREVGQNNGNTWKFEKKNLFQHAFLIAAVP